MGEVHDGSPVPLALAMLAGGMASVILVLV